MESRTCFGKSQRFVARAAAAMAVAIPLSLCAQNVSGAKPCRNGPFQKNLMAPGTEACPAQAAPRELSKREVRKLAAPGRSKEDHLIAAGYYRSWADGLDAEAGQYEEAAASLEHHPVSKNIAAPGTAARYGVLAQRMREEAGQDRLLATSLDPETTAALSSTLAQR